MNIADLGRLTMRRQPLVVVQARGQLEQHLQVDVRELALQQALLQVEFRVVGTQ